MWIVRKGESERARGHQNVGGRWLPDPLVSHRKVGGNMSTPSLMSNLLEKLGKKRELNIGGDKGFCAQGRSVYQQRDF